MKRILRDMLGLGAAVVERVEVVPAGEGGRETPEVVVGARPHRREQGRCPRCGRRRPAYDSSPRPRRWRALDLGWALCHVEYRVRRVECPVHGVVTERVPWARPGAWFTRQFEEQTAWLATCCNSTAVSKLMRVSWRTVGAICGRVAEDLEALRGASRFDGLRRIGIDETSYKRGHKYLTVVVDHDRGCVVWAAEGFGKAQLEAFFSLLSAEQREAIEVVTADGAGWIADVVADRCPNAERVMDPFHVVSWATSALDELRRAAWREAHAKAKAAPRRGRGRPRKGEVANPERKAAKAVKGSRWALLKNPEDLTEKQARSLESVARGDRRLWRAYLMKEDLRDVFKSDGAEQARQRLDAWLSWACRSRIPEFVELSRKVRRRKDAIVRAVELRISNARIEAVNNKIKVIIRMGYGFRSVSNLIGLILLRCSDITPRLHQSLAI